MKAMVAWRIDVPLEHLADPPRAPVNRPRRAAGLRGEPPEPDAAGQPVRARAGDWTLYGDC